MYNRVIRKYTTYQSLYTHMVICYFILPISKYLITATLRDSSKFWISDGWWHDDVTIASNSVGVGGGKYKNRI